jgi:hypothetical protein
MEIKPSALRDTNYTRISKLCNSPLTEKMKIPLSLSHATSCNRPNVFTFIPHCSGRRAPEPSNKMAYTLPLIISYMYVPDFSNEFPFSPTSLLFLLTPDYFSSLNKHCLGTFRAGNYFAPPPSNPSFLRSLILCFNVSQFLLSLSHSIRNMAIAMPSPTNCY